ncbi:hypothetical protein ACJRO7_031797 [Eucalyptus globulus]|uniref:Ubiquitin-like domain-containing protein n=1 Tax=Eucalyptus globulus TaxID=34317 RepID=A0ABD3JHD5_EUCGL
MIQANEGIRPDKFTLVFDGKDHRVTLAAKSWDTVRDVKAIVGALMSAQIVVLQVYGSDTAKEVKNKLRHKLQLPVPANQMAGKMLADDLDPVSYSVQENSTLLEIISPPSK